MLVFVSLLIFICPELFLRISGLKILVLFLCLCMTLGSVDHERQIVVYFQGITHMKEHSAKKGQNGLHAHSRTHAHKHNQFNVSSFSLCFYFVYVPFDC